MKKDSFEKKLASYVAMSAAYLAAHPLDVNAQIMYTDVSPDLVISQGYFNLDLNNDGVVDFKLEQIENETHFITSSQFYYFSHSSRVAYNFCLNANHAAALNYNSFELKAFQSGDTIGANALFTIPNILHSHTQFAISGTGTYSNAGFNSQGAFYGVDQYIGLKLNAGGNIYYGWARVDVNNNHIVLKDYAVNLSPDSSIIAGQGADTCSQSFAFTVPTGSQLLCDSLNMPVHNYSGVALQWMRDGVWLTGETDSILTIHSPGNYEVLLSNSTTCNILYNSVSITKTPLLIGDVISPGCGNSFNGVDLNIIGNAPPYVYLWSNGSTIQDAGNLFAGSYSVIVTDNNGCISSDTFSVFDPYDPPLITEIHTDSVCGNNGEIIISVTGGNSPFQYEWNNGETSNVLNQLPSGYYTVTVTDSNGCSAFISVTILTFPISTPTIDVSSNILFVYPDYASYQWFLGSSAISGATNQQYIPSLSGNYQVQVTDVNGCTGISSLYFFQYNSVNNISDVEFSFSVSDNKKLLFHLTDNSLLGNQIEIINGLGQLVTTVTVTNQTPEADLSALPAGIYFFHIRSKQKTYSGKFFIE